MQPLPTCRKAFGHLESTDRYRTIQKKHLCKFINSSHKCCSFNHREKKENVPPSGFLNYLLISKFNDILMCQSKIIKGKNKMKKVKTFHVLVSKVLRRNYILALSNISSLSLALII